MKQASLDAIRDGLKNTLAVIQKIPQLPEQDHWQYYRNPNGGWGGKLIPKVSFGPMLHINVLTGLASKLESVLKADYPEYLQLVGTTLAAGGLQPISILLELASEMQKRFATFAPTDTQIETILAEVSGFFDRKTVRLRLYASALNLYGPRETPPIAFPGGIVCRPITDEEFTRFYGGNPIFRTSRLPIGFLDFVFVKETETAKVLGKWPEKTDDAVVRPFQEELDLCMLALAAFKDAGAVGHDGIRVTPAEFTLGPLFADQLRYSNEHISFTRYELTPEEAPKLEAFAKLFDGIHPTLEMASERLVDGGRRTKPRDALVDAVIGLENILLACLEEPTELSFRFSLHYATLFPTQEREDAYRTAKHLYNVRSKIAHGSLRSEKVKINGKELTLGEAAVLARSVLRKTIMTFISNPKDPDFMSQSYWLSKELGLEKAGAQP